MLAVVLAESGQAADAITFHVVAAAILIGEGNVDPSKCLEPYAERIAVESVGGTVTA